MKVEGTLGVDQQEENGDGEPYTDSAEHEGTAQHTSAYVSIRKHTSAQVSIRQHTSAYVS
jgi:hypothetical protein